MAFNSQTPPEGPGYCIAQADAHTTTRFLTSDGWAGWAAASVSINLLQCGHVC